MSTWTKQKLGDEATIIDCPHSTPKWVDSGVFVIRNFNLSNGRIIKGKTSFVSEATFIERTKRVVPQRGDSVLSREAPIGSVGYISTDERMCLGQRVVLIRPGKDIDSRFLLYQLLSVDVQNQFMQSDGSGSTVSNLRIPLIKKTIVSFTDITSQRRVASVLGAYDSLIENNNRRIKMLEEMAQLLYTEWFVKFKFPGHQDVKLVDSGTKYGKIPEGWRVDKLGHIADLIKTKFEQKNDMNLPLVDMSRLRSHGLSITEVGYSSELTSSRIIFEKDDILFGSIRSYLHKVALAPFRGVTNISVFVVRAKDVSVKSLLTTLLFREETVNWASHHSSGTKMPTIKWELFSKMPIILPDDATLKMFQEKTWTSYALIQQLSVQNKNLSKTRDLLIPQLVTGKRELKEVKAKTEEPAPVKVKQNSFKDAILFSDFVGQSYTSTFFPTHLRVVKYVYFGDRLIGVDPTTKYAESRFGPYNSKSTYAGGEKLALVRKYVQRVPGGFKAGQNISEINKYTYHERGAVTKVLSLMKSKKDSELELLATVDYILYSNLKSGEIPTEQSVFQYISNSPVWGQKIDRLNVTLAKVADCMVFLRQLTKQGLSYPVKLP